MRESGHPIQLPMRNGVSASVVSVPHGAPQLLDFLAQRMPGISRSEWAERLAHGLVLHEDGQAALPDQSCQPGQRLYYYRHLDDEPVLPFQAQVLFEDDHLLVVDKPHFMPVTPSGRYVQQSLLVQLKRQTGCADLVPLHRIDRETAGLVLFGKRMQDRDAYHALFRDHLIHKTYHAVAAHAPHLKLPLVHTSRLVPGEPFFRTQEVPGPANSETRIALLYNDGQRALYALEPISGKRHQLRVHMNAMGIPIEGDQFYPSVLRGPDAPEDFSKPLQLLAQSVRFTDPITGQTRTWTTRLRLTLSPP
ncbi:pseudouridine synthase [Limnohabitans sp. 63ED37-2]|uniref:pseudouridine synthase n=1 Tax=Limnohabitans sp. 63ED37-2 TaxID=1678128 RepID=UPI0007069F46|nr:pseudouridine synthase [Limnohabitans sp. 63ED37-2]ALK88532.1 Ribosomal large subunit pseudouridine synthase A [Limnohabitans sp. 63ED37-2]